MPKVLSGGEFARIFSTRAPRIAWFLGAGSSAAADIPTGYDMILDFKTRLYTEATGLTLDQVDCTDPLWRARISAHFDGQHGFPPDGDPTEYSVAFAAVYPDPRDRRSYIDEQVRKGSGSYGHRVLASLISTRRVPAVVTTNFDQLVERTAVVTDELLPVDQRAHLNIAAIDSAERGERALTESDWPLLLKLHGDYQEIALKNTSEELREQDARQRANLIGLCGRFGLFVVGYSGRDASVMHALSDAIAAGAFPGGLFWMRRPRGTLLPAVNALLDEAEAAGIDTAIVEVATFDELAGDLVRNHPLPDELADYVSAKEDPPVVVPVQLPTVEGDRFPVLRCSALPILDLPNRARQFALTGPISTRDFQERLRALDLRKHVVFSALGSRLITFGRDDDFIRAGDGLGIRVDGYAPLEPENESWAAGLLIDALAGALARGRPLRRRQHHRLQTLLARPVRRDEQSEHAARMREQAGRLRAAYRTDLIGRVPRLNLPFAEGVHLRLERRADRWWCVYEPFTWIDVPRDAGDEVGPTIADWNRDRWAGRYNKAWADIIAAWADLFTGGQVATVTSNWIADGGGVAAQFVLGPINGWARPAGERAVHSGRVR